MFISVEGADRVGKDSFLLALDKKTHWQNCNMMRGPAGCLTYDKIYNRETQERYNEALSVATAIKSTRHLIVYLYADVETIEARLAVEKLHGGDGYFAPEGWSISDVLSLYEKNIDFLYSPSEVIKINTSNISIDTEVELVLSKIEEIRAQDLQLIEDTDYTEVKSPNSGDFTYTQYLPYSSVFTKKDLEDKGPFDIYVDLPYYEMLEKTLEHKLHEYRLGWINRRQIVYTSNDCISLVQILIKDSGSVEYIVSQRSCDVEKHKMNDILFFEYFSLKNFPGKDFRIRYTCAVPHKYIKK